MLVLKGKLSAYTVYLIYSGASSLFLSTIFTVDLVYQVQVAHLNPLQLVLVGTVLEAVCFLSQVPTGVLADVFSRRLAIDVGVFLIGAGFILEGSIPRFGFILLAQILWGLGATFTDGAQQAWITGEVGEDHVGHVFTRGTQAGLLGGLIGACISVGLASIRLNLPIIAGGGLTVLLAVFLLLFMPEHGFRPAPKEERPSWREMGNTLRAGIRLVRLRTVLLIILLIELFYGLSSEGIDRLSTAHFLADFTFPALGQLKPVVWFAIFEIVGTLLSLAVTEIIKMRINTNNERVVIGILFLMNALNVVCVLVFALTGNFFLAAAAFLAYGAIRSAGNPDLEYMAHTQHRREGTCNRLLHGGSNERAWPGRRWPSRRLYRYRCFPTCSAGGGQYHSLARTAALGLYSSQRKNQACNRQGDKYNNSSMKVNLRAHFRSVIVWSLCGSVLSLLSCIRFLHCGLLLWRDILLQRRVRQ